MLAPKYRYRKAKTRAKTSRRLRASGGVNKGGSKLPLPGSPPTTLPSGANILYHWDASVGVTLDGATKTILEWHSQATANILTPRFSGNTFPMGNEGGRIGVRCDDSTTVIGDDTQHNGLLASTTQWPNSIGIFMAVTPIPDLIDGAEGGAKMYFIGDTSASERGIYWSKENSHMLQNAGAFINQDGVRRNDVGSLLIDQYKSMKTMSVMGATYNVDGVGSHLRSGATSSTHMPCMCLIHEILVYDPVASGVWDADSIAATDYLYSRWGFAPDPIVTGSTAQAVTEFSQYLSPLNGIVSWSITVDGATIDQDQPVNGEKQSIFDAIRAQIASEVIAVESVTQNGDVFTASSSTATLTGFQLSYVHTG